MNSYSDLRDPKAPGRVSVDALVGRRIALITAVGGN